MPRLPNSSVTTRIGVGCAYLAAGSPTGYEKKIIEAAFDEGARHFDVAPQYGRGTAETVLGKALRGHRDAVTLVTKAGICQQSTGSAELILRSFLRPWRAKLNRFIVGSKPPALLRPHVDFSPAAIAKSLEDSLRNLRTDRVDALMLHMAFRDEVTSELIDKLLALRAEGKALSIGLATTRDETTVILSDWPNVFDLVQYSWSVLDPPLKKGDGELFTITHRAIMRALEPLTKWISKDLSRASRLNEAVGLDLSEPEILGRLLIGAALAENVGGITLVASRSIKRTRQNVRFSLDNETIQLGRKFAGALALEERLPELSDA